MFHATACIRCVLPKPTQLATGDRHEFDAIVAACDVPGIQKVLPESFRQFKEFDNIYELDAEGNQIGNGGPPAGKHSLQTFAPVDFTINDTPRRTGI